MAEIAALQRQATWLLALVVGTIGGLYGIGGGSILAPILIALGYSVYEVAPATLTATFLTSLAGIATYRVLQTVHGGTIAPQWILGAWLGAGGFAGSYAGARLQQRLPERNLRRLLGVIACLVAACYLQTTTNTEPGTPHPATTPTQPDPRTGEKITRFARATQLLTSAGGVALRADARARAQDDDQARAHRRSPRPLQVAPSSEGAAGQFEMTVNFLNGSLNVQTDCVPLGNEAMSPALSSTRSPVSASSILTEPSRT